MNNCSGDKGIVADKKGLTSSCPPMVMVALAKESVSPADTIDITSILNRLIINDE